MRQYSRSLFVGGAILALGLAGPLILKPRLAIAQTASAPITGWPPEYDAIVVAEVTKYPELTAVAANRVGELCPRWGEITIEQRKQFYAALFYAIAGLESGRDRSAMALEKTFAKGDPVTQKPVVSEGLLQLSYQDGRWYKGCEFDFSADKEKYEQDWNLQFTSAVKENAKIKSWHARNVDRTILMPRPHLACALTIVRVQITHRRFPDRSMSLALQTYWAVMNKIQAPTSYNRVVSEIRKRLPHCFPS